jgi:hypothetical protein
VLVNSQQARKDVGFHAAILGNRNRSWMQNTGDFWDRRFLTPARLRKPERSTQSLKHGRENRIHLDELQSVMCLIRALSFRTFHVGFSVQMHFASMPRLAQLQHHAGLVIAYPDFDRDQGSPHQWHHTKARTATIVDWPLAGECPQCQTPRTNITKSLRWNG